MERYKDLHIKEKTSVVSCIAAFTLGWILTIAGFITPPVGEVSDSVLWVLGQSLLYTAAVLGISNYYSAKLNEFKTEIRSKLK